MKKILLLITSCLLFVGCEDYTNYRYRGEDYEFRIAFEKEFGEIPSDQSWDFFEQLLAKVTRGSESYEIESIEQPDYLTDNKDWETYLPERDVTNATKGASNFNLISNGEFKCYAVWYGSSNPARFSDFTVGMLVDEEKIPLFGYYPNTTYTVNPKFGKKINIGNGTEFKFYISYNNRYITSDNQAKLLYSNISEDKQIMIIAFEDTPLDKITRKDEPDFNDIVLYLEGNPNLPILQTKRFFCEDLGAVGDFDYNDIVFDVQPNGDKTNVILQALGGTLPIKLYVNDICVGNDELHSLLGVKTSTMVNVGVNSNNILPKTIEIDTKIDNLATFNNVHAVVTYSDGENYTINFSEIGKSPVIMAVPSNTPWMKETVNIKKGFPLFYQDKWFDTYIEEYIY